jgi:dipeptidyl aminopeptidase/acylaminoacyl peptidase
MLRLLIHACAALVLAVASGGDGSAREDGGRTMTVRDLSAIADIEALALSPDSQSVVFLARTQHPETNTYAQAWYVMSLAAFAAPRLVAYGGDPLQPTHFGRINGLIQHSPPAWSPDGRWIAYLRKDNGRTQIWRSRIDDGSTQQLTHNDADSRALVFSPDGRRVLFETEPSALEVATALQNEGRAGFRYDRRFFPSYSPTPVMPADVVFGAGDSKRNSGWQDAQRRIWVYDFQANREREATEAERREFVALTSKPAPKGRQAFRELAAFSGNGAIAWTEARDPNQQGGLPPVTISAQRTDTPAPIFCEAKECTSQRFKGLWWRDENEVFFARGEGTLHQDTALYGWRIERAAPPRLILRTHHAFASLQSQCGVSRDRLICFYEEPARPRRIVAINLDDGRVDTLFDPNADFVKFDLGPVPQRLEFRSPSGIENYGYLVLPPRKPGRRLSLVVVTYRCAGFLRGGTGDEYPIFAFAAEGHAVLCFNVPDVDYPRLATMDWASFQNWARGSGDPEKKRTQESLETAIAELERRAFIDSDRIGLTGLSFGAETTAYAMWHMPRLAAAVASGTGFEPANTFLYGPAGRDLLKAWGLGDPNSPRWNELSLSRNAAKVRAPFLLNVADREMISTLQPMVALEDSKRAVEMYVFGNEHHQKWQPAHRLAIYERNIDWMNFWLQGREDSDPAKAEQYKRWRAMRVKQCELFGKEPEPPWYCRQ